MVIKDVSTSYDALGDLLELIENFSRRLNIYTKVQSMTAMTETVVKILVELLALATQQVKQGRLSEFTFLSRSMPRLSLKKEPVESWTTAALTLGVVHTLVKNMGEVTENEKASADDIRQILCAIASNFIRNSIFHVKVLVVIPHLAIPQIDTLGLSPNPSGSPTQPFAHCDKEENAT
ncbi:hypothetical protein EDB83DRAFT_2520281 [Lactarius deliciosus]|nr:hypothetical protein EDB83DRAFT_2520281 [Lactarius deliciosus]